MSEDILKRVANDITSPDFNPRHSSKASTTSPKPQAHVSAAFQQLQNQIIRLTK